MKALVFNFLDSPPGSGKTTAIIRRVNECISKRSFEDDNKRFLIVTPYLSEVTDICSETACKEPIGIKSIDIKGLIRQGVDICCTHSLFLSFDTETLKLIQDSDKEYILVIDEELPVLSPITDRKTKYSSDNPNKIEMFALKDFKLACEGNLLIKDKETNQLLWNTEHDYNNDSKKAIFDNIKDRLHLYNLYFDDDASVIQVMKKEVWEVFSSVTFCSYRLKESYLAYYCQLLKIKIEWYHLRNHVITKGYLESKPDGLDRIIIFTPDDPNEVTERQYHVLHGITYSKSWYDTNFNTKTNEISKAAEVLRNAFRNWRNAKVPKDKRSKYYWTCYKGFEECLVDKNLSKRKWIPCNQKATDDYADCFVIGYLVNRFPNVNLKHFLNRRGIEINQKEVALSEFIQFLWRSNIRKKDSKENVYAFVPSKDLYNSFIKWRGY